MRGLFFLLAIAFSPALYAQAPDLSALDIVERSVPDGPVASVDDIPIAKERFLRIYHEQLAALAQAAPDKARADSVRVKTALSVLAELIQWEVLHSEGKKAGIAATEPEVAKAYQEQLQVLQHEAQREGGAVPSEAEVLQRVDKTREEVLQEIRKALIIGKMRDKIVEAKGKGGVADAEIKKFYEDNPEAFKRGNSLHLKQIYIRPLPNAKEATEAQWQGAQQKMEQALARIHAGESFDAVAKTVSDAPDKNKGGDMGPLPLDQIPPFYVEVAKDLKPNGISSLFRTKLGLHIIQLVAREDGDAVTLEEATPRIKTFLQHNRTDSVIDEYCQNIAGNAERVKIYLQLDRTLATLPELKDLAAKP